MSEHRAHYLTVRPDYGVGHKSNRRKYHSSCDCGWVGTLVDELVSSARQYSAHLQLGAASNAWSEVERLRHEVKRLNDLLKSIQAASEMRHP
ncbi:MAG: hypothetical protein L0Y66_20545 [Myxococcaceae bacterium]|nr:hypothetical protein [Myxococcaceae bacterium]